MRTIARALGIVAAIGLCAVLVFSILSAIGGQSVFGATGRGHRPSPPPVPTPPPPTSAPVLLFSSEFDTAADYTSGAAQKWKTSWPLGDGVNSASSPGEVQIYVDVQGGEKWGPNPFIQGQSMVGITATPTPGLPAPFTYTSGVLSTAGIYSTPASGGWYIETRAMAPSGKGFWPTFWLMPWSGSWWTVNWPPELDIFQMSSRIPTESYPAMISGPATRAVTAGAFVTAPGTPNLSQAMHTFGLELTTGNVFNWYIDGKLVMTQKAAAGTTGIPYYLIFSLAAGDDGTWIGKPDGSTARWWIDYARVYNKRPT